MPVPACHCHGCALPATQSAPQHAGHALLKTTEVGSSAERAWASGPSARAGDTPPGMEALRAGLAQLSAMRAEGLLDSSEFARLKAEYVQQHLALQAGQAQCKLRHEYNMSDAQCVSTKMRLGLCGARS